MLIFAVLALTETGPGALSLDAALGQEKSGTGWALAAAGAGVAGAVGVHILAEATPAPQESPAAASQSAPPATESAAPTPETAPTAQ